MGDVGNLPELVLGVDGVIEVVVLNVDVSKEIEGLDEEVQILKGEAKIDEFLEGGLGDVVVTRWEGVDE